MYSLLPASLLVSLLWTAAARAESSCSVCEDVHFFLARGNNEPYPGRQGALVAATCDGLSSCGYEDLIFSDLYTDLYCQIAYLILAGYSSGGQAAGEILAGGGGKLFNGCIQPDTPALDFSTSPANQIAAVIIFGDVRHTANQSYNFGSGAPYDGWFPRTSEMRANLNQYAGIMRNWCVDTDPICAAHLPNPVEESHLDYFDLDSQAVASWIKSVASLTDDSKFSTVTPTSISGTVQNYATIGSQTPSGSVSLDTTWTSFASYSACTATSYSQYASNGTAVTGKSSSTQASAKKTASPTAAVVSKVTGGTGGSGTGSPTPTGNGAPAGAVAAVGSGLYAMAIVAMLAVMFL